MTESTRYPELVVSGSPRILGRKIGEALREQIRGFCAVALEQVQRTLPISREAALAIVADAIPMAEAYSSDMVEELRGTAEGASVSFEDIMLLQVRNQLKLPDAGCTSFSMSTPCRSQRVLAQNWDNDPLFDQFTVVLTRRPTGKPAFTTVTQAGLIAYIGFNDAGIGVCLNTLPAPSRTHGVPHYFTVRGIYESRDLEGAIHAVRRAERAIPANIMMTTPQGAANLEVTIDAVHVLTEPKLGFVSHANHCKHPNLLHFNEQFPELINSHPRQARIDDLLHPGHGTELPLEKIERALCDHDGYPKSICRHNNDDPKSGFWSTVFSVIIEPESRVMHLTRGTPCNHPYETYHMS